MTNAMKWEIYERLRRADIIFRESKTQTQTSSSAAESEWESIVIPMMMMVLIKPGRKEGRKGQ